MKVSTDMTGKTWFLENRGCGFARWVLPCVFLYPVLVIGCGGGGGAAVVANVKFKASTNEVVSASGSPSAGEGAAAGAVGFGTFKGKVVLEGSYTERPPLFAKGAVAKDADVCGAAAIPDESFLSKDGGVQHVFLYLKKAPKGVPAAETKEVIFDQKGCVFLPHTLVVRAGQTVKVLNSDGVLHNTHTFSQRNPQFNQGVKQNDSTNLVYGRAESEPIAVGCDIHPWMIAYHLPVDHPYATVSNADGTFEIPNLPVGTHEFVVWHEKLKVFKKDLKVKIEADKTTELNVSIPAGQLSADRKPVRPRVILATSR